MITKIVFDFNYLETIVDPKETCVSLLKVLVANKTRFLPKNDEEMVKAYVIKKLLCSENGKFDSDLFAKCFSDLYNLGLHEQLVNKAPNNHWIELIAHKYYSMLNKEQLEWIFARDSSLNDIVMNEEEEKLTTHQLEDDENESDDSIKERNDFDWVTIS